MSRLLAQASLASLALPLLFAAAASAQALPTLGRLGARPPQALAGGPKRDSTADGVRMRVQISPAPTRVGERVRYHALVLVPRGTDVRFGAPETGGDLTWGDRTAGRTRASDNGDNGRKMTDSVWVDLPLQVFRSGYVDVPGLTLRITPFPGTTRPGATRLPIAHLIVIPSITAADSNAQLRPVRGPLGAPWWERISWRLVGLAVLLLAVVIAAIRYARRRPALRPAPALVRPLAPRLDPAAEALQALARLRAERLPEAGRFGEHALALTRILRRYLEATVGATMPGDTSSELLARLRSSRLSAADLQRLEGLLGFWDRVKFAQAPMGVVEAQRCEAAVEGFIGLSLPTAAATVAPRAVQGGAA